MEILKNFKRAQKKSKPSGFSGQKSRKSDRRWLMLIILIHINEFISFLQVHIDDTVSNV